MAGGVIFPFSAEVTERIRPGNAAGPGFRMHFKSPITKNLSSENPIEKNVILLLKLSFWVGQGDILPQLYGLYVCNYLVHYPFTKIPAN